MMCICGEVLLEFFFKQIDLLQSDIGTAQTTCTCCFLPYYGLVQARNSRMFFCYLDCYVIQTPFQKQAVVLGFDCPCKLCSMYEWYRVSWTSLLPLRFCSWIVEHIHGEPARHWPIRLLGLGGLHDLSPDSANIFKLLLQLIMYNIWRERNCKISDKLPLLLRRFSV